MSKYYVVYKDKGSCGQIMTGTGKHNDLYIFEDEKSARLFIDKITKPILRSRIKPRITGFYSEEIGNVFEPKRKEPK